MILPKHAAEYQRYKLSQAARGNTTSNPSRNNYAHEY